MSYKKFINFIFFFFLISSTFFFIIALFNYYIDPYNFFNNNKNTLESKVAQGIIAKKKVIIKKSVEEGLVRYYLIKDYQISKEDIIVMGSSRGYQFTSDILNKKVINLSIGGQGLNDIMAYYNFIKKKNPQSLIIIFDPWIFSKNFDHIQPYFYQYYLDESEELGYKVTLLEKIKYLKRKYFYLIDSEILIASLRTVFSNVDNNYFYLSKDEKYGHDIYYGFREDGSIIYPNSIEKRNVEETNRITVNFIENYINYIKKNFEFSSVKYQLFVKFIKKISVTSKVVILITPYHPLAYKELKKNNNFIGTEKLIKKENFTSNVKILGSYSPFETGCENLDFYDYNHAKISCFNKMINIKK